MSIIYTVSPNLCTAGIYVGCLRSKVQEPPTASYWILRAGQVSHFLLTTIMLACSHISFIALQPDIIHLPQTQQRFLPEFVQTKDMPVTSLRTLFCIPNTSRPVYYLTQQHSSPFLNSAKGILNPSNRKLDLRRKGKF